MSDAVRFLNALAQVFAVAGLYEDDHPARRNAIESSFDALITAIGPDEHISFSFFEEQVICGEMPLLDLKRWPWAERLAGAGLQRLEFERGLTRHEFHGFLADALGRLGIVAIDAGDAESLDLAGIRYGALGLGGMEADGPAPVQSIARLPLTLHEEVAASGWVHETARESARVPVREAEAIVHAIALTMQQHKGALLPLLELRGSDQYTSVHSINVAVLTMGLAEFLGIAEAQVRELGAAALLHDVGKVLVPDEILNKPGKLTTEETGIVRRHTGDGARLLLRKNKELAAAIAFEHHMRMDGKGYPATHYRWNIHPFSRLVSVCDVYDALCTRRPFRAAWSPDRALRYIVENAGSQFDPKMVVAFRTMVTQWTSRTDLQAVAGS